MRHTFLLACALCAPGLLVPAPAGAASRQKIAVLDVRAVQGVQPGTASVLTAIVVDETSRGGYDVVSQADIMTLLGFERQKRILGCSEDSCLAELGGALGADYVLSGQVGEIGSRYHLSVQLLDARRGKVIARAARFSDRSGDALAEAAQQAVRALVAGARQALPVPGQPRAGRPDLAARPPGAVGASIPPPPPPPGAAGPRRTAAWITLGAGAALLAGGALFGLQAKGARDDLAKADWRDPGYAATYDSKSKVVRRDALLSNVCWAAGAVTAGVGGWLWWTSRPPAVAVAPALAEGRLALTVGGAF
jgi:TolB-like protein